MRAGGMRRRGDTRIPIEVTAIDNQGNEARATVEVIYVGVNDPAVLELYGGASINALRTPARTARVKAPAISGTQHAAQLASHSPVSVFA